MLVIIPEFLKMVLLSLPCAKNNNIVTDDDCEQIFFQLTNYIDENVQYWRLPLLLQDFIFFSFVLFARNLLSQKNIYKTYKCYLLQEILFKGIFFNELCL